MKQQNNYTQLLCFLYCIYVFLYINIIILMNEINPLGAPRDQRFQKQGIRKEIIWFFTFRDEHEL